MPQNRAHCKGEQIKNPGDSLYVLLKITIELDAGALLSLINKASCNLISQNGQFTELKRLI